MTIGGSNAVPEDHSEGKAAGYEDAMRRAELGADIPERSRTQSGRIAICYNRQCPDYRVERDYDVPCGCKRNRVMGAGR